jgi:hypothetical protein
MSKIFQLTNSANEILVLVINLRSLLNPLTLASRPNPTHGHNVPLPVHPPTLTTHGLHASHTLPNAALKNQHWVRKPNLIGQSRTHHNDPQPVVGTHISMGA